MTPVAGVSVGMIVGGATVATAVTFAPVPSHLQGQFPW